MNLLHSARGILDAIDSVAVQLFPGGELDHQGRLVYNGPSSLVRVESLLNRIRIVPLIAALALFPFLRIENLSSMYGILGLFVIDLLFMELYVIKRAPFLLYSGHVRFCIDCIFIGAAITLTSGPSSLLTFIYYPILAIHCLRFGRHQLIYGPMIAGLSLLIATSLSTDILQPDVGFAVFHYFWLQLMAFVLTLVVDRGRIAESRLTEELRRTRALLRAAHAPAANLSVAEVLASVAAEARGFTESDFSIVLLDDDLSYPGIDSGNRDRGEMVRALLLLVSDGPSKDFVLKIAAPVHVADLPNSAAVRSLPPSASLMAASIPGQDGAQGIVTVMRLNGSYEQSVHYEALSAFLERAALAIQNARLYERLQEQVDELRTMHEQIVRTERLAAIGEIAAKVAHELNNPLTSIHLYNSMLLEEPVEGAEQQRLAASVMEQVERAKRVVHDILDFSRPQESHPEIASLNGTVEYGLRLVQPAAQDSGVVIVEDYARGLPDVLVDSGQMAQIFTNLATNAIQAMSQGGKLLVRTGMQGEELYVSFTDTGTGISPADQDRIFEPFFTTKSAGEGTGLGLSVVKGLVGRHHGRITVDSEPGRGSTFTVWLPPSMETNKEGMVA